jgi:hypothetical protein
MEDSSWTLRITGNGRKGATAFCRKHKFEVGQPLHFDEEYDRITSLEYALGALAADLVTGFSVLADKRRFDVDDLEAVVQGRLQNPLTYLGVVGEEGHPGIHSVSVKVYVSSPEPEESVRAVWEEMLEKSPLYQTFASVVDLHLEFIATI